MSYCYDHKILRPTFKLSSFNCKITINDLNFYKDIGFRMNPVKIKKPQLNSCGFIYVEMLQKALVT